MSGSWIATGSTTMTSGIPMTCKCKLCWWGHSRFLKTLGVSSLLSAKTTRICTLSSSRSEVTWFSIALGWPGMTKGIPSAWIRIISLNSHNLIITSTAAGWTWLFPAEQICFAFRTIWSGQDVIFMMLLLISSQSSFSLFKANILWGKDNFFRDQKISCYLCSLFHLKAWLLRKGLHWKRKRPEQVIRIWGGSKTCLHFKLNII